MRVVSLLPATTEIVHALGRGDTLVGRSHECDHPAGVEALPVCTEPRVEFTGASCDIDAQLKGVLEAALSLYEVHVDVLREVAPDVVLTQSLCEVCAVSLADVQAAVEAHLGDHVRVVACEPNALADVRADVRRVAEALGVPAEGERVVAELDARIDAVRARVAGRPPVRVATVEWVDPFMAAGNWMPELVEAAGGVELFGIAGAHSPWTDLDALAAADPDVVVAMPCGFGLARTVEEVRVLWEQPAWRDLRAVREGRVAATDGHRFFNRPGPRLAESVEILAEILHPGLADGPDATSHHGDAWVWLDPATGAPAGA
ncbi:MAG: cobalamin-binding protein [Actinomycetes bacterium]